MRRLLIVAVLLVASAAAAPAQADTADVLDAIHAAAVEQGASEAVLVCLATKESRLDPHAVGALGEVGLFQLYPRGNMWPLFYARGFDDPWSADQQARFAAWAITAGYGPRWSTWGACQ